MSHSLSLLLPCTYITSAVCLSSQLSTGDSISKKKRYFGKVLMAVFSPFLVALCAVVQCSTKEVAAFQCDMKRFSQSCQQLSG